MKKLILPACLVAGTAVGAGMIALPMVLCKIGLLGTLGLILSVWAFMYISSLIGVEINLRARQGLPLGALGKFYDSPMAAVIGTISVILLIYALLSAYLHGGASVIQSSIVGYSGETVSLRYIVIIYALGLGSLLMTPVRPVLQANRVLFTGLLIFFGLLVFGLLSKIKMTPLPWLSDYVSNPLSWSQAITLLSASFGFQVVLHTLTNFCQQDPKLIKQSIFWGSLIPVVVYIIWTFSTLTILYQEAPEAYAQLQRGQLEAGQFIQTLAQTATWPVVQILASLISLLAIIKSSIGVGLGLLQTWQEQINRRYQLSKITFQVSTVLLTLIPPLLTALLVPQLFLKALSFAGVINIVIAIFLPVWLINRPKAQVLPTFYPIANNKLLQRLCLIFGIIVVICEVINLI
ncbi:MAG: aromatic amino acid transport family protein [Janthinobacterium lividum]